MATKVKVKGIRQSDVVRLVADECKRSFFYFVKTFWDTIIKEDPVYNWHIPYLCEELEKVAERVVAREPKLYDLIINIPPGTTKSTIVTVMFPVWLWVQDATLRIITNSYAGPLSTDHAMKSRDIIESEKFRMLFPHIQIRSDKRGKTNYQNTLTGFRYATSTGATVTGIHAHVIINDDPENTTQAESESWRIRANDHTKTLSSRKVNKANTPVITIMQRLHAEDVTGYLLKQKGESIKHICMPAELTDFVSPAEIRDKYIDGLLDPIRLDRKTLDEAKIDLGSRGYAGQYLQQPSAEGGNIIKEAWFQRISRADYRALRFRETVHSFLDTAYDEKKAKTDNDPSGIISACKIQGNLYITNAKKVWKEFPELLRFLPEWMASNDHSSSSTLRIEPKANGISVYQELKRKTELNVAKIKAPTESKGERLHAVSPKIECGRVYLVEGDWNDEFIDEVCGFPQRPHDEYVDILVYAIKYFFDEGADDLPENIDSLF